MMHSKLVQTKIEDAQKAVDTLEKEGYELKSMAPIFTGDVLLHFTIYRMNEEEPET